MRYWFYYSILLGFSFPADHHGQVEMFCTTVVPAPKGISEGPALKYFNMIHRGGQSDLILSYLISFHLISSHLISSHLISSHLFHRIARSLSLSLFSLISSLAHVQHVRTHARALSLPLLLSLFLRELISGRRLVPKLMIAP